MAHKENQTYYPDKTVRKRSPVGILVLIVVVIVLAVAIHTQHRISATAREIVTVVPKEEQELIVLGFEKEIQSINFYNEDDKPGLIKMKKEYHDLLVEMKETVGTFSGEEKEQVTSMIARVSNHIRELITTIKDHDGIGA